MLQVGTEWNPMQARLKELILRKECFDEAVQLLFAMHSILHMSGVYPAKEPTFMDEIWNGLDHNTFRTMPTLKDATVAWDIWHVTRIEDLTVNLLVAKSGQVLDKGWLKRLNTGVTDTGNAMTDEEIIRFSSEIVMEELRQYRSAVGRQTRAVIEGLRPEDMKRKVDEGQLNRILEEGGVLPHRDSVWLLDFWGRKTVAGIFLMPVTRHQVVHLNDCVRLKGKCRKMFAK